MTGPPVIYVLLLRLYGDDVSLYLKCHSSECHINNPMFWLIWPCYAFNRYKSAAGYMMFCNKAISVFFGLL